MKITIDIPKEFEEHYKKDRFRDSLLRLKCDAHLLAGDYEKELADMLAKAFENTTTAKKIKKGEASAHISNTILSNRRRRYDGAYCLGCCPTVS